MCVCYNFIYFTILLVKVSPQLQSTIKCYCIVSYCMNGGASTHECLFFYAALHCVRVCPLHACELVARSRTGLYVRSFTSLCTVRVRVGEYVCMYAVRVRACVCHLHACALVARSCTGLYVRSFTSLCTERVRVSEYVCMYVCIRADAYVSYTSFN